MLENAAITSILTLIGIIAAIWIFVEFCSFAKNFALPGKVKLTIYILTIVAVGVMNYLFSQAKSGIGAEFMVTNPKLMAIAIVASLAMVFVFAFALMAEISD